MQINVKYVNFPKPGSKWGSLKTVTGELILCPPDLLQYFRSGQTTEANTKQQTWFTGTPQEELKTIVASISQGGNTGAVQGQGGQTGYQQSAGNSNAYRSNTGAGGPANDPANTPAKDRNIFVCGVVQQAMSSGKFTASEIAVLTAEANRAFDLIGRQPARPASVEPPPGMEQGDPGPELQ